MRYIYIYILSNCIIVEKINAKRAMILHSTHKSLRNKYSKQYDFPNISLLCVTWQRFLVLGVIALPDFANVPYAFLFVVGTEEIGRSVLFVPRASSAGKAISRSDPPMTEYRPLKSQPYLQARARVTRGSFIFLLVLDDRQPRFDMS